VLKRLLTAAVGVFGLVVIGLGIASATVWRADDVLVAATDGDARTLVTDPGVLELGGDPVTITVHVPDKSRVVLAVGRDTDVEGWVGTDAHDRVTGLASWERLAVKGVDAAPAASPSPSDAAAPADPAATEAAGEPSSETPAVADPTGNDMWVAEADGDGTATLVWHAQPGRWSLLAVSPDSAAAPTLSLAWPRVVTTPWLWPCVVVGGLLVLLSVGLMLRQWLRRRAGVVGPQWQDVTTGPTPAVEPARTGQPALTRRQLREAAAAGSTRLTVPSAPRNPSGDSGAEMPAPVGPSTGARTPSPTATHAAEGPGLTAVTAASSRRALRTGSVPVVPAGPGQSPDRPQDPTGARPGDHARVPASPTGAPSIASPAPWGGASSAPSGAAPGRTLGWTPTPPSTSQPAAPGNGPSARPAGSPVPAGAAGQPAGSAGAPAGGRSGLPGTGAGVPGARPSSGDPEHPAHGRPTWATGPIPVTRPAASSSGPTLPPPGAVVGGARTGGPGSGAPGAGPGSGAPGASARPPAWSAVPPPPGARSVPGAHAGTSGPDAPRSHAAHRPTWLNEPPAHAPAPHPSADEPADQAGSRGDAWRRAWGLPPLEQDAHQDTTREEGR